MAKSDYLMLQELVHHARTHSPFYADSLGDLPPAGWKLADLPLLDVAQFWHVDDALSRWPALTAPLEDAYIFRSGGSTGKSKYSLCTRDEWRHLCARYGASIATRLKPGDRVANLFFSGNLYASHLFIHASLSFVPFPICEFPFTGAVDLAVLAEAIAQQSINVLACVPMTLLQLADHLDIHQTALPCVTTILYGGDSLFADQLPLLRRVFPCARCESIGYASVEIGLLGASLPDCREGEHRTFDNETLLEIIDEDTGEVIEDMHRAGMLIATSLTRRLTPLIRCPTGDVAAWCEPPGAERKFVLLGRSRLSHQIRIGHTFILPQAIEACVDEIVGQPAMWQLVLSRMEGIDHILLRIAAEENLVSEEALHTAILREHPALEELIGLRQARLTIDRCRPLSLQLSARTGKLQRVIDLRLKQQAMPILE